MDKVDIPSTTDPLVPDLMRYLKLTLTVINNPQNTVPNTQGILFKGKTTSWVPMKRQCFPTFTSKECPPFLGKVNSTTRTGNPCTQWEATPFTLRKPIHKCMGNKWRRRSNWLKNKSRTLKAGASRMMWQRNSMKPEWRSDRMLKRRRISLLMRNCRGSWCWKTRTKGKNDECSIHKLTLT